MSGQKKSRHKSGPGPRSGAAKSAQRGGKASGGRGSQGQRGASRRGQSDGGRAGGRRSGSKGQAGPSSMPKRRNPNELGGDRVEGRQAVVELLRAGRRRVSRLVVAEEVDDSFIIMEILDLAREDRIAVERVPRKKLDAMALTDAHQGVMAEASALKPAELEELLANDGRVPFLLVLDGITDPGNLGAILRTADVAGVTGVVLPRHRAVRITPSAAKSAAGAIEYLPMALVGGLPAAIDQLAKAGVWSYGLDAGASESIFSTSADFAAPTALVLGAEGQGLGRLVGERCDQLVSIPQTGHLDSLNVASAAAIACFEVVRRRS